MRFSRYLADLPAEEKDRLVDTMSVGFGRPVLAMRELSRDAEAVVVLNSMNIAQDALLRAQRLLSASSEGETVGPATSVPPAPPTAALRWREFLATLHPAAADRLLVVLQEAVRHTKQAAELVTADEDHEAIRLHLVAAATVLLEVGGLIASRPE